MKRLQSLIISALAVMVITSCGASYQQTKADRTAREKAESVAIVKAIKNQDFILDVTQIIPVGFPSRTSTGEYQLRMKDNVINTRLPYIGSSYQPMYGGVDDISIVFDNETVDVVKDFSDSAKGEYGFSFKGGKSSKNEKWTVTLRIFDNGRANIYCTSSEGRSMSYFADLEIPDKK